LFGLSFPPFHFTNICSVMIHSIIFPLPFSILILVGILFCSIPSPCAHFFSKSQHEAFVLVIFLNPSSAPSFVLPNTSLSVFIRAQFEMSQPSNDYGMRSGRP
jgi:hypothetical protein